MLAVGLFVFRDPNSTEILTTEGSSCFAIFAKVLCIWLTGGIVSGVASGAATFWSLAAFTPVCATVPISTPIASVKTIIVNERNFWFRAFS